MPYKSLVRLKISQIEATVLIYAGNRLREARLTGHEMAALKRALDKLTVGIAAAQLRDTERAAKAKAASVLDQPAVVYDREDPHAPKGGA